MGERLRAARVGLKVPIESHREASDLARLTDYSKSTLHDAQKGRASIPVMERCIDALIAHADALDETPATRSIAERLRQARAEVGSRGDLLDDIVIEIRSLAAEAGLDGKRPGRLKRASSIGQFVDALNWLMTAREATAARGTLGRIIERLEDPPVAQAPRSVVPLFVGRDALLREVWDGLRADGVARVLTGYGGIGKTQAAARYAARFRLNYRFIGWLNAASSEEIARSLASYAPTLLLRAPSNVQAAASAVRGWLSRHHGWLLIFDDAPEPAAIGGWLPDPCGGHVLATSRHADWRAAGWISHRVPPLERSERIAYLQRRVGEARPDLLRRAADRIGGAPLVLAIAADVCHDLGIEAGLTVIEAAPLDALDALPADGSGYAQSFTASLAAVLARLEGTDAYALAALAAHYAPNHPIPLALFGPATDGVRVMRSLRRLKEIVASGGDGTWTIHGVRQRLVRALLTPSTARESLASAAKQIACQFDFDGWRTQTWERSRAIAPHVRAVVAHLIGAGRDLRLAGELTLRLGRLRRFDTGDDALADFERAIDLLPPDSDAHCAARMERAQALRSRGRPDESRKALYALLQQLERSDGSRLLRARIHARLVEAELQRDQERAESLAQEGLRIARQVGSSPQLSECLNVAGRVALRASPARAQELFLTALEVRRRFIDDDHPWIGGIINNLAFAHRSLGNLEGARRAFEAAVANRRRESGEHHHNLGVRLGNLSLVYRQLCLFDQARRASDEALELLRRLLGDTGRSTAYAWSHCARQAVVDEDWARAEACVASAEAAFGRHFAADHNEIAIVRRVQGQIARGRGDLSEAIRRYEDGVAICQRAGGSDADLGWAWLGLADVLVDAGAPDRAREPIERTLAHLVAFYGERHHFVGVAEETCGAIAWLMGERQVAIGHWLAVARRAVPAGPRGLARQQRVAFYRALADPQIADAIPCGMIDEFAREYSASRWWVRRMRQLAAHRGSRRMTEHA